MVLTYVESFEEKLAELESLVEDYDPEEDSAVQGGPEELIELTRDYISDAREKVEGFKEEHRDFYEGVRIQKTHGSVERLSKDNTESGADITHGSLVYEKSGYEPPEDNSK